METMETNRPLKRKRSFGKTFLLIMGGIFLFMILSSVIGSLFSDGLLESDNQIAVVEIQGMITQSRETVRQLRKFQHDPKVKGIIVRIDSPGGAVGPSQEIYNAVARIREEDAKKIYASLGSVAASGGYYIASAADTIFANPGTLTGSIGVIMAFSNIQELIEKIGIRPEVIKSGAFKDAGSPVRSISKEERKLLQNLVDDVHQQFVEDVAKGRNLSTEVVGRLADGRVYTGRQAFDLKMVDHLGGLQAAIDLLTTQAGIQGSPQIVQEEEGVPFLDWLMRSAIRKNLTEALSPQTYPSLQFLWTIQ
ncbi:signal peptide peptidase SppA, 36K type [hydrothermal vent metagenome]|uniref:Signal peptide peptidase SppA, 36K type n=1 Tax=hydrothermal vent metagenome TaxID=652676 RepID=A0A3B1C766_9ZZZZ